MSSRLGDRTLSLAACAVMFLWPVVTTDFEHVNAVSILIALGALLLGAAVFFRGVPLWLVPAFAVVAGVALRLTTAAYEGSDVTRATAEALHTIALHANPYLHFYTTTDPAGQPFPYMPGELALYAVQQAIGGSLAAHDRWWSILALFGIAGLAPACGVGRTALATAFLAISSTNVLIAVDGSNDTGLLFLLVAAVVALVYATSAQDPRGRRALVLYALSAVFFGWALAFKALVWIVFPFVLRVVAPERRWAYAGTAVGIGVLLCIGYVVASPFAFFQSVAAGFTSHENVWGFNLWSALRASHPDAMTAMMPFTLPVGIFATLFTAATLWTRKPDTLGETLLQSSIVLGVMMLFARWTSLAYYAFLFGTLALAIATYALGPEPVQVTAAKR